MDFSLTEEQILLRDSVAKFVQDNCDVERHRHLSHTELGFDPALWQEFAQLGWLALPFAEAQGGLGGSATDIMVLSEALGGALVREPYLHSVVICGGLLSAAPDLAQQRYIPGIIDGSQQWAFAFAEEGSGYDLGLIETRAEPTDTGYALCGRKIAVLNGHCADHYIVSARLPDQDGPALFVLDAGSAGIEREDFTAIDGSRGTVLELNAVQIAAQALLAAGAEAQALLAQMIENAIIAMGAEALGATQTLLNTTVEYTKTREQFGQPISKFQALQHRMADMYLGIEELRSLLYNAAIQVEMASDEAAAACSALKVKAAQTGRLVSHEAVQLHGGIGMSDELIVGPFAETPAIAFQAVWR